MPKSYAIAITAGIIILYQRALQQRTHVPGTGTVRAPLAGEQVQHAPLNHVRACYSAPGVGGIHEGSVIGTIPPEGIHNSITPWPRIKDTVGSPML